MLCSWGEVSGPLSSGPLRSRLTIPRRMDGLACMRCRIAFGRGIHEFQLCSISDDCWNSREGYTCVMYCKPVIFFQAETRKVESDLAEERSQGLRRSSRTWLAVSSLSHLASLLVTGSSISRLPLNVTLRKKSFSECRLAVLHVDRKFMNESMSSLWSYCRK